MISFLLLIKLLKMTLIKVMSIRKHILLGVLLLFSFK